MNVRTVLDMIGKTLKDTPKRQGISHFKSEKQGSEWLDNLVPVFVLILDFGIIVYRLSSLVFRRALISIVFQTSY
jgi:hypothetical protein